MRRRDASTPVSNKRRYLRTARADKRTVEVVQILVESFQKDTLRKGVQSSDCDVDEICVKLAQLCQIGRVWVGRVAVECAVVAAWGNGVLRGEKIDVRSNDVETTGYVGPKEPVGETAVLEESPCNVHVELLARIASVYEESNREDSLGVCGEVSRSDEAELGIGGNGILDSLEPEFCSHREVVITSPKLVTEGGELKERKE